MKECTQRDTLELQLRGILDDYVIFYKLQAHQTQIKLTVNNGTS